MHSLCLKRLQYLINLTVYRAIDCGRWARENIEAANKLTPFTGLVLDSAFQARGLNINNEQVVGNYAHDGYGTRTAQKEGSLHGPIRVCFTEFIP